MKEKAIKKINKLGKIGGIVAKIARIFMIIGVVSLLVCGIILLVIPKDLVKITVSGKMGMEFNFEKYFDTDIDQEELDKIIGDTGSIDVEDGKEYAVSDVVVEDGVIKVSAEADDISYSLRKLSGTMFAGVFSMAAWIVVLVFIEKLCKSFQKCESPFEEEVLTNLKNFSISMIPWAVVSTLSGEIASLMMDGDIVLGGIDLTYVFIALVIIGLTFIFKYGAMLQKESDETL